MTDLEEDWYVMAENAICTCALSTHDGHQKSFDNEDIQPAYGMGLERGL